LAWTDETTVILRVMVNDIAETTYTDDTLQQTLVVAAFQVLNDGLKFSQDFVTDVVNITITPDPSDSVGSTRDESFLNLFTLKAASIIDRGAAMTAANRALYAKDGSSAVDLRDIFKAKYALLQKGWNAVYEDAKLEYLAGTVRNAGAAVLTPFRLFAYGNWGMTPQQYGYWRDPNY
jgi:hypothetical protein